MRTPRDNGEQPLPTEYGCSQRWMFEADEWPSADRARNSPEAIDRWVNEGGAIFPPVRGPGGEAPGMAEIQRATH
jgi:hypothetical protein